MAMQVLCLLDGPCSLGFGAEAKQLPLQRLQWRDCSQHHPADLPAICLWTASRRCLCMRVAPIPLVQMESSLSLLMGFCLSTKRFSCWQLCFHAVTPPPVSPPLQCWARTANSRAGFHGRHIGLTTDSLSCRSSRSSTGRHSTHASLLIHAANYRPMMQSSSGSFSCQLNQGALRRSILHCTVVLSPAKWTHCRPSRRQHRVAHTTCQQGTKQLEGREDPGQAAAMSATVASPYFLVAAIILFSLVAYDVRGPGLRLLPQYVDGPAHAWVRDHLPSPVRAFVAEKVSSSTHPLPAQLMLQLFKTYSQSSPVL